MYQPILTKDIVHPNKQSSTYSDSERNSFRSRSPVKSVSDSHDVSVDKNNSSTYSQRSRDRTLRTRKSDSPTRVSRDVQFKDRVQTRHVSPTCQWFKEASWRHMCKKYYVEPST